jgi:NadR type nicotinamide-nucleotide adenylyltransferase
MERRGSGMVLGKFLPPHLGHKYLVDFARSYVEHLTVVVGTLQREPIPGSLRYGWMRQMFPDCHVVHLTDENPQYPEEHPDFWNIWLASIRRFIPSGPDFVFASEEYGWPLAKILGAKFVPVDIQRELVPVSGTAIRNDPYTNWQYLPECVRTYFLRRVCIFGPESTGKSTLARKLAKHFGTTYVSEYARALIERQSGACSKSDLELILRGQQAAEAAMRNQASKVLFADTDAISTLLWSQWLFQDRPDWLVREASSSDFDLYLLCDTDVPWVADTVRYLPNQRTVQFEEAKAILDEFNQPYIVIRGSWDERFTTAVKAVEGLFCPADHRQALPGKIGLQINENLSAA